VIYNCHMKTKSSVSSQSNHHQLDPLVHDLVNARKVQKFTQQQLADMAGVSRRTIVLIEAGGDCTLGTLRRMATALGMEMQAYKPQPPTLDDLTRENELLFADRRSDTNNWGR